MAALGLATVMIFGQLQRLAEGTERAMAGRTSVKSCLAGGVEFTVGGRPYPELRGLDTGVPDSGRGRRPYLQ
jgi:hypothetical protein